MSSSPFLPNERWVIPHSRLKVARHTVQLLQQRFVFGLSLYTVNIGAHLLIFVTVAYLPTFYNALHAVGQACIQKISQPAAGFFSWAGCEIAKTNIIFINSFYVAYLCDVICDLRRMSLHHDCCLMMSLRGLHQTKRLRGFRRTMMNLFQTMSCLMMSYGWEPNR